MMGSVDDVVFEYNRIQNMEFRVKAFERSWKIARSMTTPIAGHFSGNELK
jgi:hypothetical protein